MDTNLPLPFTPAVGDLPFTARQRSLLNLAHELGRTRFAPRAAQWDESASFPFANYEDLRDAGLQVGADIYCDTQLIIAELEKRHPRPSVFPDGNPGIGYALGSWAHGPYVVTSVAIYMGADDPFAGDVSLPRHFFEDRKKMWMTQFDTDKLKPRLPGYRTRLRAHTDFLRMQLADGRRFMTGDKPGLVDLHAMWDPWFLRRFAPAEAKWAYDPYPEIAAWEARLAEVGHGTLSVQPLIYRLRCLNGLCLSGFVRMYRPLGWNSQSTKE